MAYRKITVENKTYIAPLQMYGPILNPISVSDSVVISLVRKGYTVNQKLKNGTTVRLTIYNVRNPEDIVETTSASVKPKSTPAPVKKSVEIPKTPVGKTLNESTEAVSKPEVIDDGVRDFGETISGINTVPVVTNEIPKEVVQVPTTPEERGLRIVEEKPAEKEITFIQPETTEEVVDDTDDEEATLEQEAQTSEDSNQNQDADTPTNTGANNYNNQTRSNKKKKRR